MFSFTGDNDQKETDIMVNSKRRFHFLTWPLQMHWRNTSPPFPPPPTCLPTYQWNWAVKESLLTGESGGGGLWTLLQLSSLQTASSTTDSTCPLLWSFSLCSVSPAFHFREVWWENVPLNFCWYFFPIFGSCTVLKFLDLTEKKKNTSLNGWDKG